MITLISTSIQTRIRNEIALCDNMSIIADGTQDITGQEQFSIVFRYVDRYLVTHEDFVGFYGLPDSTGLTIAKAIEDVTIRPES